LSNSAWTPENVYILAESGSDYTTLLACFSAIIATGITATIFVMPGEYDGCTVPSGLPPVTIVGLDKNNCQIGTTTPLDLSNVTLTTYIEVPALIFQSLKIYAEPTGDNAGAGIKAVSFFDCYIDEGYSGGHALDFDTTGAGSWYLRFVDCYIQGFTGPTINFKDTVDFVFDGCTIRHQNATQTAVYLDVPTSSVRFFKNNSIQVDTVAGGETIDADAGGPYNIWCVGNVWNQLPNAAVTVVGGTVATNTVLALDFLGT